MTQDSKNSTPAQNETTPAATGAVQPWVTAFVQAFADGLNNVLNNQCVPQDAAVIRRGLLRSLRDH